MQSGPRPKAEPAHDPQRKRDLSIRGFPGSLFAPGLGLKLSEYYQPPDVKKLQEPPKVQF